MASKTILTCDVCGADAVDSVTLTIAEVTHEVDLCARHRKALAVATQPFTTVARVAGGTRRATRTSPKRAAKATAGRPAADAPKTTARKTTSRAAAKRAKPARRSRRAAPDTAAIRAWGQANGFQVGSKGRLRPDVVEAFATANRTNGDKS